MSNRKKIKDRFKLIKSGEAVKEEVIVLTKDFKNDSLPFIVCTCGWKTEPSENMMKLGLDAKDHAMKTGHILRRH